MIQIKFINATSVQLLDQNNNVVSNKGEFLDSPIQFVYGGNDFSTNDQNYYHFAITGSNVQLSGVIDSVTTKQQFINLFRGCEAITDASQLQLTAISLTEGCYANMFLDCKNLTTPPVLSATTLAMWCYSSMFGNCYSLTTAPALIATTLAKYCYYCMFYGCKSLTTSPYLPATTLTDWCYNGMFYNCRNLTKVETNFTAWNGNATSSWLKNVAPTGHLFNYNVDEIYSTSNVPNGWTVLVPLTFTAKETANIVLSNRFSPLPITLDYCKNNGSWTTYTIGDVINLASGDSVSFSGANDHFSKDDYDYYNFKITGTVLANGNIQSLMNYSNSCTSGCYANLFESCTGLIKAPKLRATTLAPYCYTLMFWRCTSLTSAPLLPATTLANSCYSSMFNYCNFSTPPSLPATTLAPACYAGMFANCTNLSSAPLLPATTLANSCYSNMFQWCSSLKEAPYLPATTLVPYCYAYMFNDCSSLSSINVNFTPWHYTTFYATSNWVSGVATYGIFTKPADLVATYGINFIPEGWTVVNQ